MWNEYTQTLATIVGLFLAVGAPVLRLTTKMTKMLVELSMLTIQVNCGTVENKEDHKKTDAQLHELDKLTTKHTDELIDHERRLVKIGV